MANTKIEVQPKPIQFVLTRGVSDLALHEGLIAYLFRIAIQNFIKGEYMTTFSPDGINLQIGDGNKTIHTDINSYGLKERLWCIIDDYGPYYVATLLLPDEY